MLPCTTDADFFQSAPETEESVSTTMNGMVVALEQIPSKAIGVRTFKSKLPDILTTFHQHSVISTTEEKNNDQSKDGHRELHSEDENVLVKMEETEADWADKTQCRTFTTLTVAKDGDDKRGLKNGGSLLKMVTDDSALYTRETMKNNGINEFDSDTPFGIDANDPDNSLIGDSSHEHTGEFLSFPKNLNESQTPIFPSLHTNDIPFVSSRSGEVFERADDIAGIYEHSHIHEETITYYSPKFSYYDSVPYCPVYKQVHDQVHGIGYTTTQQYPDTLINDPTGYQTPLAESFVERADDMVHASEIKTFSKYGRNKDVEVVIDYIVNDIKAACDNLGLNTDPKTWPSEQVQKWVKWAVNYNLLPPLELNSFNLHGSVLCGMSKSEMLKRAPRHGDILHAYLEIWQAVVGSNTKVKENRKRSGGVTDYAYEEKRSLINLETNGRDNNPQPQQKLTTSSINCMTPNHTAGIHLWQFLKELLLQPKTYGQFIRWVDKDRGIFKIEDSVEVARLWGIRKNRPAMNYDKLSRSIRQYYKKGIIKKTTVSQRLVYQFVEPSKCLV